MDLEFPARLTEQGLISLIISTVLDRGRRIRFFIQATQDFFINTFIENFEVQR